MKRVVLTVAGVMFASAAMASTVLGVVDSVRVVGGQEFSAPDYQGHVVFTIAGAVNDCTHKNFFAIQPQTVGSNDTLATRDLLLEAMRLGSTVAVYGTGACSDVPAPDGVLGVETVKIVDFLPF